jgi:lipopolysaccharide biosynthesis glycosyltransferase
MPTAYVVLLTDNKTEKTLTGKRNAFRKSIDEIVCVEFPEENDLHYRSRILKTTLPQHVSGDFLYIDCDTIVCDDLSDIANLNIHLGAVLNAHSLLSQTGSTAYGWFDFIDRRLDFSSAEKTDKCYNGGVFFCKNNDICRRFFEKWHEFYLFSLSKRVILDQPALNQVNYLMNELITELPGIWNCQILSPGAVKYLAQAKIIHYFSSMNKSSIYLFGQQSIFQEIKETGEISEELSKMLQNPKNQFDDKTLLYLRDNVDHDNNLSKMNTILLKENKVKSKYDVRRMNIKQLCKILTNRILRKFIKIGQ